MNEKPVSEPEKKELLKRSGYIARFWELCDTHPTNLSAWEAVEAEYQKCFNIRRYSSYHSFKVCARAHYKKGSRNG